jgi:hypothetical protein
MVISSIGLLEPDIPTLMEVINMYSFHSVFLPSSEDLLESMTDVFVVGKSPCRQVDLLLRARPLTLRQKVLNMDTDFLLDLIKPMNKR